MLGDRDLCLLHAAPASASQAACPCFLAALATQLIVLALQVYSLAVLLTLENAEDSGIVSSMVLTLIQLIFQMVMEKMKLRNMKRPLQVQPCHLLRLSSRHGCNSLHSAGWTPHGPPWCRT